jgi:signal transduction histidine kinase
VHIELQHQEDHLALSIRDDGSGFDLNLVDPSQCFGILDMQERAQMIGGTCIIQTAPGQGTTVRVTVPDR